MIGPSKHSLFNNVRAETMCVTFILYQLLLSIKLTLHRVKRGYEPKELI